MPVTAVAVCCEAIWPMVKAIEQLFGGEGVVELDRAELMEASAFFEGGRRYACAGTAYGAIEDLEALFPVSRLRLVAGRLPVPIRDSERVYHDS